MQGQIAITQAFSQVAPKAVGDYAQSKLLEAEAMREQAEKENDPAAREALLKSADELQFNWKEGGPARIALHTAVGALAGGLDGALGAGATAAVTPAIAQQINTLDAPKEVKDALLVIAGTAVGHAAGGTPGAATGMTQVVNNYLNHKQWEEYAEKRGQCTDDACIQKIDKEYRDLSAAQDVRLAQCGSTGNCEQLIEEVKQGTDTMLDLVRDKKLPQGLAGGADLQSTWGRNSPPRPRCEKK